jgi:hypothetical protein
VAEFLIHQLGLTPQYVEERIQTVFLDGKPVDDLTSAVVLPAATLTLSAAMPGLAGAALRRGGFFAPMRYQISLRGGLQPALKESGRITLKLFNVVAEDLASNLLARGVWIQTSTLDRFLQRQTEAFWEDCAQLALDGGEVKRAELMGRKWDQGEVFLEVHPMGP